MIRRYCVIVNSYANGGKSGAFIKQNEAYIKDKLGDCHFEYLKKGYSVKEILTIKRKDYEVFVICGGDGTFQEAAQTAKDLDIVLGLIPVGSGNDFSKSIGLTRSLKQNLSVLKSENTHYIDLVQVDNQHCFVNTFGIGFDGQTNAYASRARFLKGSARYLFGAIKTIFLAKSFRATIILNGTSTQHTTFMIIAANGKREGGRYLVSPASDPTDGHAEIIVTKTTNKFRIMYEFARLSLGRTFSTSVINVQKFKEVEIKMEPSVFIHTDGEVFESKNRLHIKVLPQAFKMLVPLF